MTRSKSVFANTLTRFFAPIDKLLVDESISEIFVNRYDLIFVERNGALERTNASFRTESHLVAALTNLAQSVGRSLDPRHPRLDAALPDGSRVLALLPPVAVDGPCIAIRCMRKGGYSLDSFCAHDGEVSGLRETLAGLVLERSNVVVCGDIASGKTALLGALSSSVPSSERLIVIETEVELRVEHDHVVRLVSSRSHGDDASMPTSVDLLRTTLDMRTDRIVLGEVDRSVAAELFDVLSYSGTSLLCSLRSSDPRDALISLERMVRFGEVEASRIDAPKRVASTIDFVVCVERLCDGRRCVSRVSEVVGWAEGTGFTTRAVYESRR